MRIDDANHTARAATPAFMLGALLAMAAVQTPGPAYAQDAEIEPRLAVRLGAAHSDNLGRVPSGQSAESATFATLGLDLGLSRRNQRLYSWVDGTLDYHHYDHDQYRNETLGRLRAGLDVTLVPDRFAWELSGNLGHRRRDPFRAPGPDNRERLATYSTGPSLRVPFGGRNAFAFNARHVERHWQDSTQLDSTAQSADVSLFRSLSPIQEIGVTASGRRVEYDSPLVPHHDVESLFVSYNRRLSAGTLNAAAGTNRLKYLGGTQSSPYFAVNWNRELAAFSRFSLFASRRFEDSAGRRTREPVIPDDFDDIGDFDDLDGIGQIPLTGRPLTRTTGGFNYVLDRPRATYSFGTNWFRQRFVEEQQLDRDGWRSRVRAGYGFTRGTSGYIGAGYGRERFAGQAGSARTLRGEVGLDRALSRTWALGFQYRYESRKRAFGNEYSENRYTLSLVWTPGAEAR